MKGESWVMPGDDLENFNPSLQWPDQVKVIDGVSISTPAVQNYQYGNRSLPIARKREELVATVQDNPVTILIGATGSGKTTGSSQVLFESGIAEKIIQTQPRIMIARNICERVRMEMAYANREQGSADHLVGYATSTESDLAPSNKIILATHGKALGWLARSEEELQNTIYMADEYHLRDVEADIFMARCAQMGLRAVIASATMDSEKIAATYATIDGIPAPIVSLDGRAFDIETIRGKDLTEDITRNGSEDAMIFLPGKRDIRSAMGRASTLQKYPVEKMELHGDLPRSEQQKVFHRVTRPRNIYSTNVGEMGITPSVDIVINPGYERIMVLDRDVPTLALRPASKATNDQRAGRTGRTAPGKVIFGSKIEDYPPLPPESEIEQYDIPAILRTRLDNTILTLATTGGDIQNLTLPDYPENSSIELALSRLKKIGAFNEHNKPTEIGFAMAELPLDTHFARAVVEAKRISKDSLLQAQAIAMAAVQQVGGIIRSGHTAGEHKKFVSNDGCSDCIFEMNEFIWLMQFNQKSESDLPAYVAESKYRRAIEIYRKVCENQDVDPVEIAMSSNKDNIRDLLACLIAGADEVFCRSGGGTYTDSRGDRRVLQKTSSIEPSGIVIGSPWDLQTASNEAIRTDCFIKSPSVVSGKLLIKYAPHRCSYAKNGYSIDESGDVRVKEALYFDEQFIGNNGSSAAEASSELTRFLVGAMFDGTIEDIQEIPPNTCSFLKKVAELNYRQHKTAVDLEIPALLQSLEVRMISHIPATIENLFDLDEWIVPSLVDGLIDQELKAEIDKNAPDIVCVYNEEEKIECPVEYWNNQAQIHVPYEYLALLPDSFPLLAMHDVMIWVGTRAKLYSIDDARDRSKYANRAEWRNGDSEVPGIDDSYQKMMNAKSKRRFPRLAGSRGVTIPKKTYTTRKIR